jgi:hypothetical protein
MLLDSFQRLLPRYPKSEANDRQGISRACVEPLESRRLLAATVVQEETGFLYISAAFESTDYSSGQLGTTTYVAVSIAEDYVKNASGTTVTPTASVDVSIVDNSTTTYRYFTGVTSEFTLELGSHLGDAHFVAAVELGNYVNTTRHTAYLDLNFSASSEPLIFRYPDGARDGTLNRQHDAVFPVTATGTTLIPDLSASNFTPLPSMENSGFWSQQSIVQKTILGAPGLSGSDTVAADLFSQTPVLN